MWRVRYMDTQILTSKDGGELVSFKLNGVEKIHQGTECIDDNGKVYWKRHSPVLFPIVGKLRRNQSIINGRTYEIFQHGFARDQEFEPITKLDNFHSYILRSNKSTLSRYPYDFELYTTYRLDENKLTIIYKVINTSKTNMPFCIGGHPAFKIDKDKLKNGDYYLEFEEEEDKIHFMYLIDGLIGTEYARNQMTTKRIISLDGNTFKNDALIMKGITSNRISLKDKRENKTLLKMDFSEFPYLAIWSKPGAPFICIEPWIGHSDTIKSTGIFAEKNDIINLFPNRSFECKYIVEFFE
jgi:galactose mutarotase-like enzyme